MMMADKIRILELTDAEAILAICLDANAGETTWKLSSFESELENTYNVYLGYEEDDTLVGFIGCSLMFETLAINNFSVLSSYKRQGIGEKLLQGLLAYGKEKGVENFILEVRVSNEAAIALYKKYGFIEIDIRKNYYEQPVEDAYIFQLTLGKE